MNKNELQLHINKELAHIACILPVLVKEGPSTFKCGHVTGYKQALLDIDLTIRRKEQFEKIINEMFPED